MKSQKRPAKDVMADDSKHQPVPVLTGFLSGAISGFMRGEVPPAQALDTDEDWEATKRGFRRSRLIDEVKRAQEDIETLKVQLSRTTSPKPDEYGKGFKGLGPKKNNMSRYLDGANLSPMQRNCLSLKFEFELGIAQIARRLGKHHSTVQYHIAAGKAKIKHAGAYQKRAAKRATTSFEQEEAE